MITAFPTLHGDELLYSALARYQALFAFPAARRTAVEVFGSRNRTAVVDLPVGLDALVARLPPGHSYTAGGLVHLHTLLPYYAAFTTPERYQRVVNLMRTGRPGRAEASFGLVHARVSQPSHLRMCPMCVAEDVRILGEAYWHRKHQLPGVVVCASHGVRLLDGVPRRRDLRAVFRYHALSGELPARVAVAAPICTSAPPALLSLAGESARLLARSSTGIPPDALARCYQRLFREAGARARYRGVAWPEVLAQVVNTFGAEYLRQHVRDPDCTSNPNWATRVCSSTGTFHPLKHLLLLVAFGAPVTSFLDEAQDVAAAGAGMTHAGGLEYDRRGGVEGRHRRGYVDWEERDRQVHAECRRAVTELLLSPGRPERITVAAVARRTQWRVMVQRNLWRLPVTAAYLLSVVENIPAWRRRRLAWVAGQFAAEGQVPFTFHLFERAGLLRRENPDLEDDASDHAAWLLGMAGEPRRVVHR